MIERIEFWRIFSLVFLVTAIPVAIIIIYEKRSPFKTIAWIMVLILLPFIGIIFYLFFGQEYRKRKLFSRRGIKTSTRFKNLAVNQIHDLNTKKMILNNEIQEKENIIRLLLNNSNALLTTGNKIQILNKGEATFNAISEAIKSAKHHIHLEYYIFSDDKIGNTIKDLLIRKSREGIQVRIIVDDVGSWGLSRKFFSGLRQNGIEIYPFMEVRFPRLTWKVNFRNHRKILIVDGEKAITGGSNIADRYIEGLKKIGNWNDLNIQIEGNAVSCLQQIFASDWHAMTNIELTGKNYYRTFPSNPENPVQIVASGPDSEWENISQAFFAAISNARKRIALVSPYFMPPQPLISALKTAALSNVDVKIIIPEKSDVITPKWSTFSYIEELLESNVNVYFYKKGFIHSKYMIVDDVFSTIGTANFDFRSLETNFEVNAFIYSISFNRSLEKQFLTDLKDSFKISLKKWKLRPWHFKLRESLAHIIAPMM